MRRAMQVMTAAGLAALATAGSVRAETLPFSDGKWQLEGKAVVEQVDGREVLSVESGVATRDVKLEDGAIDFEVQVTRRRSFVYIQFRKVDERELEEFYLRPHKSGLPDALQYAPVFQGQSGWQLYHGPGGTAALAFEPGAWTRVRVVAQGRRAALFVGDMARPALLVPRLVRDARAGSIGLRGFLPQGVPGEGPIARFANVAVTPGPVAFDFAQAEAAARAGAPSPAPAATAGIIRSWAVSNAFTLPDAAVPDPPQANLLGTLRVVEAEPQGFVLLHRHVTLPAGSRAGTAAARVTVKASTAGLRAFDLGFSDVATVFLNGRPVFRGEGRYSFDLPRREGLIGLDQARLYLPLQEGDNELVVVVSDSFGGWGVMGRFVDPSGVEVTAQ